MMAGVAVGSVIALEALFAGPICGASMNPARSLAPAAVAGRLDSLWIYIGSTTTRCEPGGSGMPLRARSALLLSTSRGVHLMKEQGDPGSKRLLFVCVENSNRSQMAEAFARMHG